MIPQSALLAYEWRHAMSHARRCIREARAAMPVVDYVWLNAARVSLRRAADYRARYHVARSQESINRVLGGLL